MPGLFSERGTQLARALRLADQLDFRDGALYARRFYPFGLRSVAPVGAWTIVVGVNAGKNNAAYIAAEHPDYGPTDLEEGEVCLFNKKGSEIRLKIDGSIQIKAVGDVVMNGGSKQVARTNDNVASNAAFLAWAGAVNAAFAALVPPVTLPNVPGTIGFVADGSPTVKVP